MVFLNFLLLIGMILLWKKVNKANLWLDFRISSLEREIQKLSKEAASEKKADIHEQGEAKDKKPPEVQAPPPFRTESVPAHIPVPEMGSGQTSIRQSAASGAFPRKDDAPHETGRIPTPSPEPQKARPDWAGRWKKFKDNVDWEQFTGKKISAWLGGFSLFIAAAFFVKYSIDNNLIPLGVRLSAGALLGIVLMTGANRFTGEKYTVMRHTLVSCGVGVLYAIVYAANYYHYIPRLFGFGLMVLVSAAAFVLAVYHRGASICILGVLGANAAPIVVSSGSGNVGMLFAYLSVVNLGVYQVVRHLKSQILLLISAAATLLTLSIAIGAYFFGLQGYVIAGVWAGHLVLFSFFLALGNIDPKESQSTRWTGYLLFGAGLVMSFVLLNKQGWPALFVLTVSLFCAMGLAYRNFGWYSNVIPFSTAAFGVALTWVFMKFGEKHFSFSFILLLLYGAGGGLGPVLLIWKYGFDRHFLRWLQAFPLALTAVSLAGVFREPAISFWFWPMLLFLQLAGIGISMLIGALIQAEVLILVFIIAGLFWIFQTPGVILGYGFFLFALFAGAILCLSVIFFRRILPDLVKNSALEKMTGQSPLFRRIKDPDQWMTAAPVVGFFVLLSAAFTVRHPFFPHPGMATLLCFLFLSVLISRRIRFQPLGILALFAAVIAQSVWVMNPQSGFDIRFSGVIWSSVLFAASLIIPFLAFGAFAQWKQIINAWAIFEAFQALFLLYSSASCWNSELAKWIPLLLAMLKLPVVKRLLVRLEGRAERNSILAFHGGALLFYISALPVRVLNHGWIGLALVFEATALLWLNRRIAHEGLRWTAVFMAPLGLIIFLFNIPLLKGAESLPVLNFACVSMAAAVISLGFAVTQAPYPDRGPGKLDLPHYFLWLAVGSGFYLLNLILSDLFAGGGQAYKVLPGRNFFHWLCYGLSWSAFGAVLWRIRALPVLMRALGLGVMLLGAFTLILLPLFLPESAARMRPLFNLGLAAYLPLMAIAFYLFSREPAGKADYSLKNLFLAVFLISGFIMLKLAAATILQPGLPFDVLFSHTASKALATAAGWLLYGLGLLLWPGNLDRPFRFAGVMLIGVSILKTLSFPFRFRADFGAMTPLLNLPTLLFFFLAASLTYLALRNWEKPPWPMPRIQPAAFWGVMLGLVVFSVLNIEIAGVFSIRGDAFSMMTHGSLSMQLAYSIGWLIFAIGLMVVGIKRDLINVRWASILLLVGTSVKIFTLDLWKLGQLYRVGAFVGLAVVLIIVSFLYQRFLSEGKTDEP